MESKINCFSIPLQVQDLPGSSRNNLGLSSSPLCAAPLPLPFICTQQCAYTTGDHLSQANLWNRRKLFEIRYGGLGMMITMWRRRQQYRRSIQCTRWTECNSLPFRGFFAETRLLSLGYYRHANYSVYWDSKDYARSSAVGRWISFI